MVRLRFPLVLTTLVMGIVFLIAFLVFICRFDTVAHDCTTNIVIAVIVVIVSQATIIGFFIRFRKD